MTKFLVPLLIILGILLALRLGGVFDQPLPPPAPPTPTPTPTPASPSQTTETTRDPWSMIGHDAQNTFRSSHEGPDSPGVKWNIDFGESYVLYPPLVDAKGVVYVAMLENGGAIVVAIDSQGVKKDLIRVSKKSAPGALSISGTLYLRSFEGDKQTISAFDSDGKWLWDTSLPSSATTYSGHPWDIIGPNGTMYATIEETTGDALLSTISSDGTMGWSVPDVRGFPTIAPDGTMYCCTRDGKVAAYSTGGNLKWEYDTRSDWPYYEHEVYCLSVGQDGTIYALPSMDWVEGYEYGRLIALTPQGSKKWHADIPTARESFYPPAIAPDGCLYITKAGGDVLYRVSSDGKLERFATGNFETPAVIDSTGTIYIGLARQVAAFHPDGSQKWLVDVPVKHSIDMIVMGADATIYAVGNNFIAAIGMTRTT